MLSLIERKDHHKSNYFYSFLIFSDISFLSSFFFIRSGFSYIIVCCDTASKSIGESSSKFYITSGLILRFFTIVSLFF